jgi:hypothetical protein
LRDWATRFGVGPNEVKAAVKALGDNARKVKEYLSARPRSLGGRREVPDFD